MKIVKIVAFAAFALLAVSCKKDKNTDPIASEPLEIDGLVKVIDASNQTHTIELFTKTGDFKIGHNALFVRVKNTATQAYESNLMMEIKPMMHMTSMSHACPVSAYSKTANKTNLYDGYVVFQMASNATEYWNLTINYTINGTDYTVTSQVTVNETAKRRVSTFTGTDSKKYILAMVNPADPKVGINNMQAMLFTMESMSSYPVVDNYKVLIDPRMPSMGNHGSPNNVNLVQTSNAGVYNGKLSLTMTGYWKINLQVMNAEQEILKGEEVSETVEASSIFFELEF